MDTNLSMSMVSRIGFLMFKGILKHWLVQIWPSVLKVLRTWWIKWVIGVVFIKSVSRYFWRHCPVPQMVCILTMISLHDLEIIKPIYSLGQIKIGLNSRDSSIWSLWGLAQAHLAMQQVQEPLFQSRLILCPLHIQVKTKPRWCLLHLRMKEEYFFLAVSAAPTSVMMCMSG